MITNLNHQSKEEILPLVVVVVTLDVGSSREIFFLSFFAED
jgi:hypothetical protein